MSDAIAPIPSKLREALRPITVICGHYGVGKTNFTCNLALSLKAAGNAPTVVDLDIVNPYFRASEQRSLLEDAGIGLVAPVFAEAGSSLDVPSLRASIEPTLMDASMTAPVLVDVGGDDAGSTALGRFRHLIQGHDHGVIGVLNAFRNLVSTPEEAVENLREIESASSLRFTCLVDNSHLQAMTDVEALETGLEYSESVSSLMGLPLVAVTVPADVDDHGIIPEDLRYPVSELVKKPWDR